MAGVDETLYDMFHRCTMQYGIDCMGSDFGSVCDTQEQLAARCVPVVPPDQTTVSSLLTDMTMSSGTMATDVFTTMASLLVNATTPSLSSSVAAVAASSPPAHPCAVKCVQHALIEIVRYENQRLFSIYAPIASIMCIIAVVTNAIGLTGLARIRPKYPRHFLLISMSISDTLLSMLSLLKKAGDIITDDPKVQEFLVKHLNVFWQTTFLASALMLLALAVEAFVALTATFLYEKFARRRFIVQLFVVLVWTISFIFSLSLLLTGRSYDTTFQYAVAGLLMLIIGVTISCYLYAFVLAERARRDIRMQRRASGVEHRGDGGRSSKSGRRKSLLTVCLLMTSSVVSWLPMNIYMMLDKDQVEGNFPFYMRMVHVFLIMFHLNAIINPLTYALRMNAVRATLRRFLRMKPSNSQTLLSVSQFSHHNGNANGKRLTDGSDVSSVGGRSYSQSYTTPLISLNNCSNYPNGNNNNNKRKVTINLAPLKSGDGDDDGDESNKGKLSKSPSRTRYDSAPASYLLNGINESSECNDKATTTATTTATTGSDENIAGQQVLSHQSSNIDESPPSITNHNAST